MINTLTNQSRRTGLFLSTTVPLISYKLAFTSFVVYYIQEDTLWARVTTSLVALALLLSIFKLYMLSSFSGYQTSRNNFLVMLPAFVILAVYIFGLLMLLEQWHAPQSTANATIALMALPPILMFGHFLFIEKDR